MEMVLCDLATSSTCSFRTLSISCSAIAFTRASCQTDHANVEVVRTSAGLHRRQTDERKGKQTASTCTSDHGVGGRYVAVPQKLGHLPDPRHLLVVSHRCRDSFPQPSCIDPVAGGASSVMSADYRKHTWQRKKGAAGQGDEKGEAQAHRAERTACHRRGC